MWPTTCALAAPMKINFSNPLAAGQRHQRSIEGSTVVKLAGFVVTGMLCIFAAVMTTVVESGGFWQYFWLGICIALFVSAFSFIIWATKDGLRIDHKGLSFEPPKTAPAEQEPATSEKR
jgi:hypothetical protein